jgi:hypothetical protein
VDVEITEICDLEVARHDGVEKPANGFSFLVTKSVAAEPLSDVYKAAEGAVYKRDVNEAERKRLAAEGKALPDGSYPIDNAEDLHNAAHLAASGHGDVAAAKRLIAKRAKELGVPNPLDESAKKDDMDNTSTPETPEAAPVAKTEETPDTVAKAEFDALAERVAKMESDRAEADKRAVDAEGREAATKAELEALRATPLPGGPVLAASDQDRAFKARREAAQKAAYWQNLAKDAPNQEIRMEYTRRAKAAEAEAK